MLAEFAAHPLFAPLRPLLGQLSGDGEMPDIGKLNALAAERGIATGNGAALRFVVPYGSGMSYNERIWWLGEVETRPGNWHDCFNALVWLGFPLTKAALNRRTHLAATLPQGVGRATRSRSGPPKDTLTRFDECGVIVTSPHLDLWTHLRTQGWDWGSAFQTRRGETQQRLRIFPFGHASLDLLRTPHIGLCAKAAFIHTDEEWLAKQAPQQLADVDARMARRFSSQLNALTCERDIHTLPLPGRHETMWYPGLRQGSQHPVYNHPVDSNIIGI